MDDPQRVDSAGTRTAIPEWCDGLIERLRRRTHEIQAQEMTKRAALDSEVTKWRQRWDTAKRWTEDVGLRAEWAITPDSPFWGMTSSGARWALMRLVAERDEARAALAAHVPQAAEPDGWIDSLDDDGRDTRTPVWTFESGVQLEGAESVSAWNEGIAADGALSIGQTVDAIERDAHRLLAAVAYHRRLAAARTAGSDGGEQHA